MKIACKNFVGAAVMIALLGASHTASALAAEMSHHGAMSLDLRTGLNSLFREHVFLAAAATGAALAGRDGEFKAAAGALDGNSIDIAQAIGSVYGAGAEQAFLPLWRKHIGFVVDYTVGVATKDDAKKNKAVTDLVQYTQDFGAFLASANPNLPKDVVANRAGDGRYEQNFHGDSQRSRPHGNDRRPSGRRHRETISRAFCEPIVE